MFFCGRGGEDAAFAGQHFQGNGSRLDKGNARDFINFHKDDSLNPYWQDMRYVENQTRDMNKAIKVSEQMECGGFVINGASFFRSFEQPFGGWKYSGIGNEGVSTTLKEMSRTKTIVLKNILD